MGDPKAFIKTKRIAFKYRPVCERIKDYKEIIISRSKIESQDQASRCMDCGTPFCHWGCPIGNYIPEWNDLIFKDKWAEAFSILETTNNLPEITGRLCPALCEHSCVLAIQEKAVTVKANELDVTEYAFKNKLIKPKLPSKKTNKKVAIVGSGPAGISAADQLNKAGHTVTVFEKDDKLGGILRYGIPDFKLEKWILDRRFQLLKNRGIIFKNNTHVGTDYKTLDLIKKFDAICLSGGCSVPRDLKIPGRKLEGIHFAMDYLIQSNKKVDNQIITNPIDAKNKNVVVIGGGDTGADCVGVANRQQAKCIIQIELLPKPSEKRTKQNPWPFYPNILKSSTSHQEGSKRYWSILTKKFIGRNNKIEKILCAKVKFHKMKYGKLKLKEIPNSEFEINADLVLLAIGFIRPEYKGLIDKLKIKLTKQGNIKTNACFMTSQKGIFAAGDINRGQSLIVWAISEGRKAAYHIDKYLMGKSHLPLM